LKQTKARLEENSNIYIVDVKEKAEGNPKKQPIKNKNNFLYFFISKYLRNDAMFLCFSLKSYFAECRTISMTSKHLKCLKSSLCHSNNTWHSRLGTGVSKVSRIFFFPFKSLIWLEVNVMPYSKKIRLLKDTFILINFGVHSRG